MKNFILLTIDTLRKDRIGLYGNKEPLTSFIDSLKNKCVIFNNAQATGPYTQVSFRSILTSTYFFKDGRSTKLSPDIRIISEPLKENGIYTAAFHSNPYISGYFGWNRGWNVFYDSMQDKVTDKVPFIDGGEINKKVNNWLQGYTKINANNPFFLWVHYMDIHEPYIPKNDTINSLGYNIDLSEDEMFDLFKNTLLPRDVSDSNKVRVLSQLYNSKVYETDKIISDFFNIIESYDLLEKSMIMLTSDHGDEFGEHGGLSHDGKMYSELINVPLLAYDFDRNKEVWTDMLVSNIDILPTVLSNFSIKKEDCFEGMSLLPIEKYNKKGVFGEAIEKIGHKIKDEHKRIFYYIEDNIKIIYGENSETWQLYDLNKDPGEHNNIIDVFNYSDKFKKILKKRLDTVY